MHMHACTETHAYVHTYAFDSCYLKLLSQSTWYIEVDSSQKFSLVFYLFSLFQLFLYQIKIISKSESYSLYSLLFQLWKRYLEIEFGHKEGVREPEWWPFSQYMNGSNNDRIFHHICCFFPVQVCGRVFGRDQVWAATGKHCYQSYGCEQTHICKYWSQSFKTVPCLTQLNVT